jgi:hypothetical protein
MTDASPDSPSPAADDDASHHQAAAQLRRERPGWVVVCTAASYARATAFVFGILVGTRRSSCGGRLISWRLRRDLGQAGQPVLNDKLSRTDVGERPVI